MLLMKPYNLPCALGRNNCGKYINGVESNASGGAGMMDKGRLAKRTIEEYEQLVFEGYSVQEISYMGTCLIRLALERRVATSAKLVPELEGAIV